MEQSKINEKERSEKLTCKCNKFMLGTRLKIKKLLITVNILKYDFPYQKSNNIKTVPCQKIGKQFDVGLRNVSSTAVKFISVLKIT